MPSVAAPCHAAGLPALYDSDLRYPGTDHVGELWSRPPAAFRNSPEQLSESRLPIVTVLGSSGFKASWQAGVAAVVQDLAHPVRWDLTSGGCIPGLACAAGINRHWQRLMNAGAPSHTVLTKAAGLRWFERKNLDLAGVFDLSSVEHWLGAWLAWAGVTTFRDLRYESDEPRPAGVQHRAGICVSIWRTKKAWPQRCTEEQLRDPSFVHRAFRWAFFGRQFPWRQFQQVWLPDTVATHLPWLADEIDDHSPAFWARVSMAQWPACVPTVLQDPNTLQLVFIADGGHIDNQPSLFNDGRRPSLPALNPRLQQNKRQTGGRQRAEDARRFPIGIVTRFPRTPETRWGMLEGNHLGWQDRDQMWRVGVTQARETLPAEIDRLAQLADELAAGTGPLLREVPRFHGFQLVAAARREHTRGGPGRRS